VQRAWREFKKGWQEADWGDYFVLALLPLIVVTAMLARLVESTVCGPIFWMLTIPAIPALLFWAGIASGPGNWLGRITFSIVLVFLAMQFIKRLIREGKTEGSFTHRIGRFEVTIPVKQVADHGESVTVSQQAPPWWRRSRKALETMSAALDTAAHASWLG
jgi:hypothetical protein